MKTHKCKNGNYINIHYDKHGGIEYLSFASEDGMVHIPIKDLEEAIGLKINVLLTLQYKESDIDELLNG